MAHVVTRLCVDCKDKSCTTVCPCECFHEGAEMLYIDPQVCIDCEACVIECPVEAIFHEDDVPDEYKEDVKLNADMVKVYPIVNG